METPQWPEAQAPAQHPLDTFQPAIPTRDSPMAVASLVSGILCWFVLPFVGAVVAVVTGVSARREIRAAGGTVGGWNMATLGLWFGAIQLVLIGVAVLIVLGLVVAGVGFAWSNH